MKSFRLLFVLACALAGVSAHGQISVELSIKQRLHILHEPVIATVVVTNQTGRDITLADTAQYQWFGFRITGDGDTNVPPRNLKYGLDPLAVRAGETVKRSVDLNKLFELGSFGIYRIQASIYYDGLDKFFSSRPTHVEITEGRVIWRQVAGVPEGQPGAGQMREFSLLAHQRGETNKLYVRVVDKDDGTIYGTYSIGRLLDNQPPQAQFDASNRLYVLQLIGQKSYALSVIGPNGEFLGQTNYSAPKTRPYLRKTADGTLQLVGGHREVALAQNPETTEPVPKVSDRPPGLPKN